MILRFVIKSVPNMFCRDTLCVKSIFMGPCSRKEANESQDKREWRISMYASFQISL